MGDGVFVAVEVGGGLGVDVMVGVRVGVRVGARVGVGVCVGAGSMGSGGSVPDRSKTKDTTQMIIKEPMPTPPPTASTSRWLMRTDMRRGMERREATASRRT